MGIFEIGQKHRICTGLDYRNALKKFEFFEKSNLGEFFTRNSLFQKNCSFKIRKILTKHLYPSILSYRRLKSKLEP